MQYFNFTPIILTLSAKNLFSHPMRTQCRINLVAKVAYIYATGPGADTGFFGGDQNPPYGCLQFFFAC